MAGPAKIAFVKAQAYGNDFLFVDASEVEGAEPAALARAICHRTRGLGADGLIRYHRTADGATMTLVNADGSHAEVSGNGVRCLGAILASGEGEGPAAVGAEFAVGTDAGVKRLVLLEAAPPRYTFRASMGAPRDMRRETLDVNGEQVAAVVLSVGNPQCVVLTSELDEERFHRLGPRLARHRAFPAGTNVAFVEVQQADRVRVLIWERGVGPTEASGTGACASAVAAAAYGGAARRVDVAAPGGTQRVEWDDGEIWLTGWAEMTARGRWIWTPSAD